MQRPRGRVLSAFTEAGAEGPVKLELVHFGGRLEPMTHGTPVKGLESKLERKVELGEVAIAPQTVTREEGDLHFIAKVVSLAQASHLAPNTTLCLTRPTLWMGKHDAS